MAEENSVLILGAGLVTGPGVKYVSAAGYPVTVASRTLSKAEKIIEGLTNAKAVEIDVLDEAQADKLEELVKAHALVVSLLPWTQHLPVAKMSLKNKKHFVTTSYIADEMQALHEEFKAAGVVSFNEVGVDPGLDHMSAMKIIDQVHAEGGLVDSFTSYCGGLPCPDDNDNPFGYKFSWSPRGVLLAAIRTAKYLENGEEKTLDGSPGKMLYEHFFEDTSIPDVGPPLKKGWPKAFECHPNGDSVKFVPIYNLKEAKTLIRGTYRNVGWCPTMKKVKELGLLSTDAVAIEGKSYAEMMATLLSCPVDGIKAAAAAKVNVAEDCQELNNLEWLGLFSADKIVTKPTFLDALVDCFETNPKFWYQPKERDMLCMHHTFEVTKKDGSKVKITSTMVNYGLQDQDGDSGMARLVTLPMAITIKKILSKEWTMTGVVRPVTKDIYEPILAEMETYGVTFNDKETPM